MSNKAVEALNSMLKQKISEIHTSMPGTIVSVDYGTCRATVKPTLSYHTADGQQMDYPLITGAPVFMPHAGNAQITYPVKAGDSCWIVFAERSIDEWLGKGSADNHDPRQYDLTDAMCFVGLMPAQSISDKNIELLNGSTSVSITPEGQVNIIGNVSIQGNITCTGKSTMHGNIECQGDIQADGDVTGSGVSLNSHTHGGVESGGGTTGEPI